MQIKRTRGDTSPDVFTVTTNNRLKTPVNLTGCSFKLTVSTEAEPVDSTAQVYQLTGNIPDPANGKVEFAPTVEQADHVGYFFYDVQMTDSFGQIITLVKDSYLYVQDITK